MVRRADNTRYHFFDATTDVGLPTVYGIRSAEFNRNARTIVACATGTSYTGAIEKVFRDLVALSRALSRDRPRSDDVANFSQIFDGAAYMGRPEHQDAFQFLLGSSSSVTLRELEIRHNPIKSLRPLISKLSAMGTPVIAVDLYTQLALQNGLRVVKVLIPSLQPLSFAARAQYKAHPRLYSAPAQMGYQVRCESQLNEWPQPFA